MDTCFILSSIDVVKKSRYHFQSSNLFSILTFLFLKMFSFNVFILRYFKSYLFSFY